MTTLSFSQLVFLGTFLYFSYFLIYFLTSQNKDQFPNTINVTASIKLKETHIQSSGPIWVVQWFNMMTGWLGCFLWSGKAEAGTWSGLCYIHRGCIVAMIFNSWYFSELWLPNLVKINAWGFPICFVKHRLRSTVMLRREYDKFIYQGVKCFHWCYRNLCITWLEPSLFMSESH